MIRVLVGYCGPGEHECARVETLVRSIPSLEFAGSFGPAHPPHADAAADVLLIASSVADDPDWAALADLPIPVVLLAHSNEAAAVEAALRAGIRGVISSDATEEEVETAVHAVHAGLVVTMPSVIARLLPDVSEPMVQPFGPLEEPLSAREREVLELVAEGLSNKLIAHALSISEHTVKTHIGSIFAKLGVSSRTEAVSQALRRGLVML